MAANLAVPRAATDRRRELTAATVGSVVEAFDWNMYAILAPFFAVQLFGGDGVGALLAAYAGFAVGFVARPAGAALIGRLSDRRGRRAGLTLVMGGIAAASLGLALIPTEAAIGLWAALIAVVMRLAQGLAYGGETPAVAAYVTETAPRAKRFLYSSISYAGIAVGSLLSYAVLALMYAVLGEEGLTDGGWRWGFVAAALVGLAALWVRRTAPESEDFERMHARKEAPPPFRTVLTGHPWSTLVLFMTVVSGTVGFYFGLVYLPKYAAGLDVAEAGAASSYMTVVMVFVIVGMIASGLAADRFGALRVLRIGTALPPLLMLPLLYAMANGVLPFEVVAVVIGVLISPLLAMSNVFGGLLYPVEVRAVGFGVVGAVTVAAFGGTFSLLAEWLTIVGAGAAIPFYVTACLATAPLATLLTPKIPGLADQLRAPRAPEKKKETADVAV